MSVPFDPTPRLAGQVVTADPPATRACGWCVGSGKYLEAVDCDVPDVYLPVVCQGCQGTGRTSA